MSSCVTDQDFIAAMQRDLPPIAPPVRRGADAAAPTDRGSPTPSPVAGGATTAHVILPAQEQP
ncbi:hypothetical protein [Stenotrophomonas sp. GZD-301]|uniref:hypothetical protein n=1 Tax=Stenotrophomonas sp. GZD-301 TaxID=3404814 RepID=UPI003BB4A063